LTTSLLVAFWCLIVAGITFIHQLSVFIEHVIRRITTFPKTGVVARLAKRGMSDVMILLQTAMSIYPTLTGL
jgi:hypothetical protein